MFSLIIFFDDVAIYRSEIMSLQTTAYFVITNTPLFRWYDFCWCFFSRRSFIIKPSISEAHAVPLAMHFSSWLFALLSERPPFYIAVSPWRLHPLRLASSKIRFILPIALSDMPTCTLRSLRCTDTDELPAAWLLPESPHYRRTAYRARQNYWALYFLSLPCHECQ
jgi:hypothetical protein